MIRHACFIVALCALPVAACSPDTSDQDDHADADVSDSDAADDEVSDTGTSDDAVSDDDASDQDQPTEPDPTVPPTINALAATPAQLPAGGGATTLAWNVDDASTLSLDDGLGHVTDVTGATERLVLVNMTRTYTLIATNTLGSATASTAVEVLIPDLPPSILAFTADDTFLPPGGATVRLSWSTSDATTLAIDNAVGDVWGRSFVDVPVTATTAFKLTAGNIRGSAQSTLLVQVQAQPPPSITSFSATPSSRTGAGYVTLSWTTQNADELTINQGVGDVTFAMGSTPVFVNVTTTYTLTARNAATGQSVQSSTTVFVE